MDDNQFTALLEVLKQQNSVLEHQTEKLDSIQKDFSEFKGKYAEKVGGLEEDARSDRRWGRIQTIAVMPFMAFLHQIAQHYGWIK